MSTSTSSEILNKNYKENGLHLKKKKKNYHTKMR